MALKGPHAIPNCSDVRTFKFRGSRASNAKFVGEGRSREWPEDIVMSEDIKNLVDRRWKEYGF